MMTFSRSLLITATLFFLALGSLFPYRAPLSHWLWNQTHMADASFFLDSHNPEFAFEIANYYFNHGGYNLDISRKYFEKAIALNPNYLEAHYQLARVYFLESKYRESLSELDIVEKLNPDFEKTYYMRGLVLGYQGRLIDSIPAFEEFIRHDSFNWAGYNDLAWIHFQLGEYEKTRSIAAQGLERAPTNAWLLNMEGLALLNLGRKDEAREYFARAQKRAREMTPADWGIAYPGNDPSIYAEGLERMREAIGKNLLLVESGS